MNARLENTIDEALETIHKSTELRKEVLSSLFDLTQNYKSGIVDNLKMEELKIKKTSEKDVQLLQELKKFFADTDVFDIELTSVENRFKLCDGWYGELLTRSGVLHTFDIFKKMGQRGVPLLRHKHEFANKTIVIINGEVDVKIENKYIPFFKTTKRLKEGQSLFIKCNTYHTIIPRTNVKLLSIFKPPILE